MFWKKRQEERPEDYVLLMRDTAPIPGKGEPMAKNFWHYSTLVRYREWLKKEGMCSCEETCTDLCRGECGCKLCGDGWMHELPYFGGKYDDKAEIAVLTGAKT